MRTSGSCTRGISPAARPALQSFGNGDRHLRFTCRLAVQPRWDQSAPRCAMRCACSGIAFAAARAMRQAGYWLTICSLSVLIGPQSARAEPPHGADIRSVGDSIVEDDVRVTMLDARRLSADEYRLAGCNTPDLW